MIAIGWEKVARAMLMTMLYGAMLSGDDSLVAWCAAQKVALDELIAGLEGNIRRIMETGKGNLASGFDDLQTKINAIKELFAGIGKTEFYIPDKIYEASKTFAEGWHDALSDANNSLHNWGAMAASIVEQAVTSMQSAFSNLFQNILKGQLNSAKDFFIEWGNFVLKIISDVIAQIITAKIISSIFGIFSGSTVATAGLGNVLTAPANYFLGHASGIERVPETGIYKLHRNEQVVPAYDQAKTRDSQLVIYNLITNEAVAAAMQSKEGQGVIVNVIDVNASRGGIVRKVIKRG
jgi:hypothetical protein